MRQAKHRFENLEIANSVIAVVNAVATIMNAISWAEAISAKWSDTGNAAGTTEKRSTSFRIRQME